MLRKLVFKFSFCDSYCYRVIILLLFTFAFIFIRDPYAYIWPIMGCEDGGLMYAYYTNHTSMIDVFRFYNGYVSLLPNIVGYISATISPTWAPYLLSWFPLLIATIAHSVFYLRRYRIFISQDGTRLIICLVLTFLPIGYSWMVSNTTYSLWNMLWITLLLVYPPVGTTLVSWFVQALIIGLTICSHPISLVAFPLCFHNFFQRKDYLNRAMNLWTMILILCYQWLGVERFEGQIKYMSKGVLIGIQYVIDAVVSESLLGYRLRLALFESGAAWLLHLIGLGALGIIITLWLFNSQKFTKQQNWLLVYLLYSVFAITILNTIGREMTLTSHMEKWNWRYFYVQQFLYLLFTGIILSKIVEIQRFGSKQPKILYMLLISFILFQNWHNYSSFRTPLVEGKQIQEFMNKIESNIMNLSENESEKFLLIRPCFNIDVTFTKG